MKKYEVKFNDGSVINIFTDKPLVKDFQQGFRTFVQGSLRNYYIDFSTVQYMIEMDVK